MLWIQIIDMFYASHIYMLVRRAVDTSRISNEVNENGVAQSIIYCRNELTCSFCCWRLNINYAGMCVVLVCTRWYDCFRLGIDFSGALEIGYFLICFDGSTFTYCKYMCNRPCNLNEMRWWEISFYQKSIHVQICRHFFLHVYFFTLKWSFYHSLLYSDS